MEIDPKEVVDTAVASREVREMRIRRLNAAVAITVAILATFMGICKVKDDNTVQAMQQAQADKIDHWAFYQARNLRQEVAEAVVVQLNLARDTAPAARSAVYEAEIAKYQALVLEQARKKEELRLQAGADQARYDALNSRDDQFDLSDALISISIALLAVTALTGLWSLYWVSLAPALSGVVMGVAGLASLPIHPDALVRLLS